MSLTHDQLVQRAVKWLRGTMRCGVVFAEIHTAAWVNPDAIGFRGQYSILVECKTSRADFWKDRKKLIFKYPDSCPGQERWYLTPPGLVKKEEVPDGWGLLEVRKTRIYRVVESPEQGIINPERSHADVNILYSAMRRVTLGVPFDASIGRFAPAEVRR